MGDSSKKDDKKYESFEDVFSKACLVLNQAINACGKTLNPDAPMPEIAAALERLEKDVETFVKINKKNEALIRSAQNELPVLKKEDVRLIEKAQKLIEDAHLIKKEMQDEQEMLRKVGQEEKLKLESKAGTPKASGPKEASDVQQRKSKFKKAGGSNKWKPV